MRRNDIDNLRWICILLLFPFHTFTLYNNWGEAYYVHLSESSLLSLLVRICQPWFMPLLFVLAGVSTVYALEKRTPGQYLLERVFKLFVPLWAGILLIVPSLTYFAERFHNGYAGSYVQQYRLFFSKTDLVGYFGGFTPAHLWFLAYLSVISAAALPLVLLWKKHRILHDRSVPLPVLLSVLLSLFTVIWLFSYILDINGKSLGRYFILFLLGVTLLSRQDIQKQLKCQCRLLSIIWSVATLLYISCNPSGILRDLLGQMTSWFGILALLGIAARHLGFTNSIAAYFTRASFPIYIFHLPWIIATAYYVPSLSSWVAVQVTLILCLSFTLTLCTYETVRRIPFLRILFGMKK